MKNKKIFITGGAGFLGKAIISRYYDNNEITVYSRDEAKHYLLKKKFPQINCIVGDVRNFDLLKRVSINHNIGIFTASLKQIEACDSNYEEASQIIINGSFNSRRVAEENGFEAATFISSDKSRSATTIYGAMKYVAGESFIINPKNTRLTSVIYGNVLNSTGSIIPLIWDSIKENRVLTLFSEEMTRFLITSEEAVDLIEKALNYTGFNIIPRIESAKISDLFNLYVPFGLQYKLGEPRLNEKIHEIMISKEESSRTKYEDGIFLMSQNVVKTPFAFNANEYSSKDVCVSKRELQIKLSKFNYYQ